MSQEEPLNFAQTEKGLDIGIRLQMASRHGLIAGATGTGKTVTMQVLAESFSRAGVPVFLADIKGDLSGISKAGSNSPKIEERTKKLKLPDFHGAACPVLFWDIFGKSGHPIRATVSEMGPILLSRLLGLNDVQTGVMQLTFKIADEGGLLLLDLKDLRAMLQSIGENAQALRTEYGNVAPQTIGAIQRALLNLDEAGGEHFFGEPALLLRHFMQTDFSGNGVISVLDATTLINDARIYSTFLLWLLSELFETLDEVGDINKPRLIFFFDEAHLLFKDTPKSLVEKIEQVVRLVRSRGVGVYFVTQNPLDLPESVLGQLGNRVQHALRAFTPSDQKAVRTAADTFRQNPDFSAETVITELGVGEALVSVLDDQGSPTPVERAFIYPPKSRIGVITQEERKESLERSPLKGIYDTAIDRESAYEVLKKRREQGPEGRDTGSETDSKGEENEAPSWVAKTAKDVLLGSGRRQGIVEAAAKSFIRSVSSNLGRQVLRGVLGSMLGKNKR